MAVSKKITAKDIISSPITLLVGGYFAYKLFLKPLLETLNIVDTPDEKIMREAADKANTSAPTNYWTPTYYKYAPAGKKPWILTETGARTISKRIYDAMGYFNDDEEAIYGQFKALQYKTQISYLASIFFAVYKKDLFAFIESYFNDKEMVILLKITETKPTGFH